MNPFTDTSGLPKMRILLTALYMLMILTTSIVPMDREFGGIKIVTTIRPGFQNFLHIPMFALLSILWMKVLNRSLWTHSVKILLIFGIGTGFGILNELVQLAVPGRYPSLLDTGLNALGTITGIGIFQRIEMSKSNRIRHIVCK